MSTFIASLLAFLGGIMTNIISDFFWGIGLGTWLKNKYLISQKDKTLKSYFSEYGNIITSISKKQEGNGKEFSRNSDQLIVDKLKDLKIIRHEKTEPFKVYELKDIPFSIISIGSIRYNTYSSKIQEFFDLGFEFINDSYEADPGKKIIKIINKYGDEYSSSIDLKSNLLDCEVDYGLLFIGKPPNNKRILWVAGIHGMGTMGVFQYFENNSEKFLPQIYADNDTGKVWLFRILHERIPVGEEEAFKYLKTVEVISHIDRCPPRTSFSRPKAIICDFGNVIMFFDRDRTYRALGNKLGIPFQEVRQTMEDQVRIAFESGQLSSIEFYNKTKSEFIRKFKLKNSFVNYELFREIYGDIFWLNVNMIEALKKLKEEGVTIILLSNTNEIHMSIMKEHYPDVFSVFNNIVLSYEVKAMKPHSLIFEKAIELVVEKSTIARQDIIYIDDIEEYVYTPENGLQKRKTIFRRYN